VDWIVLLLIGLIAGVASGMFGIGGGVVIVPALVGILGMGLNAAVGTSLAALLMPVGIFAVIAYYRAGKLRLRVAIPIALGLIVGARGGAGIALALDTDVLARLYGVFLIYAGWRFAEPRKWMRSRMTPPTEAAGAPPVPTPPAAGSSEKQIAWYWLLGVGLGAGVLSGMFGIGGGIVIVPALVGLLKFDQKVAVATSLGALLLPVSIFAVIEYYQSGLIQIDAAVLVAVGLVAGSFGGAKVALGLPSATVKRLYGAFLLVIALRFIFPELFGVA
jgi:uncharacterized membrane protein YfcA